MTYLLNLTMVVFCSQLFAAEDANISGKESYVSFEDAQAALPDKEVYNRPGDDRSTPDWEDDPGAYEFSATIAGAVIMNDGVQMGGAITSQELTVTLPTSPAVGTEMRPLW